MGFEDYKPGFAMIACQFLYSGLILIGRAALLEDMSSKVFVFYSQCIAFLLIAPFAFFSRKERKGYGLDLKQFSWVFLLSLVGITVNQNIYFEGLGLASSAMGSASFNLVPAITFLMAYTLGLEKVNFRNWRSLAKTLGTAVCVSGAVSMALLKGTKLLNFQQASKSMFVQGEQATWLIGCLLLLGSSCCWSLWLILQAHVYATYPDLDRVLLTTWMCLVAAVQSGIWTLIFEPNSQAWKLTSSLPLACCFFAGFASATTYFAQAWCIARKGPLFSALFNPLTIIIVTIYACVFMHEELYVGSLVGALAVIVGLYMVLWGKSKDHKDIKEESISVNQGTVNGNNSTSCETDLEDPLLSSA